MNWPEWTSPDGRIRLICADCLEVLPGLEADVLITDPPYNVDFVGKATKHTQATKNFTGGYVGGDSDIGPVAVAKALEKVARAVVFPGNRMLFEYPPAYDVGCVYCPSGAGLGRWGFVVLHPILFYGMALPHGRQGPSGFSSFATVPDNGHPCPKPISWMEWAVKKATTASDVVADIFAGSCTTAIACIRTDRRCIAIEKEERYWQIGIERCKREYARTVLFDEVEARD